MERVAGIGPIVLLAQERQFVPFGDRLASLCPAEQVRLFRQIHAPSRLTGIHTCGGSSERDRSLVVLDSIGCFGWPPVMPGVPPHVNPAS